MSTSDPVREGILEVLDDLKEDGRRRYIKRRSKDELEEILVVAWRGRDEAKMHSGDLPEAVSQIRVPVVTLHEQGFDLGAAEATKTKQLNPGETEITEKRGEKRCAPGSLSTTQSPQKQRTVTSRIGIARYFSEEENQDNQDAQEPAEKCSQDVKLEIQKAKDVLERLDHLTDDDGEDTIPITSDSYNGKYEELPLLIYVPDKQGARYYANVDQLPIKVYAEIQRRFKTFYTGSAHKSRCFKRLINNPETYIDRQWCVCGQLVRGLNLKQYGRPAPTQKFTQGGKLRFRADDRCIEDKIPCAHLIEHEGGYAIFFVPLPKREESANWTELGFWVQD